MDTVLQNGDYAGFGKANPKDRRFELESDGSFLFSIIPDDDLCGD